MYCHFRQKFWKSIKKNSFKLYRTEHRTDPLLTFCTRLYTLQLLLSDVTGQIEHIIFRINLVDLLVTYTYRHSHTTGRDIHLKFIGIPSGIPSASQKRAIYRFFDRNNNTRDYRISDGDLVQ